ncbi:MAG: hypothetical protein ABIE55_03065 [Candidatus Aenigmatarchaeota archaeon]
MILNVNSSNTFAGIMEKIPNELRFRKYKKVELRTIKDNNPEKFKRIFNTFNKKYKKLYDKYVLNMELPPRHPILEELDKWDEQLGIFLDIAKERYE